MKLVSALAQKFIELRHHADDAIVHSTQRLYDGLRFPPNKVAESYLRNELTLALELRYEIEGRVVKCAAFVRQVPVHQVKGELESSGGCDDNQCAMLVNDVEFVNSKQKDIGGVHSAVVRLKPLDQFENSTVSDSLYFSFVLGEHVRRGWPFFQDGEVDKPFMVSPVLGIGKVPNDMVEARPKMVGSFSSQDAESKRNLALTVVLNGLRDNLLIIVAENRVFAFLKKPCDFGLKIVDVLVGPI